MHGGNRGGSRPPAINSVAGKAETAANIQQGKQRTITQMFFNPPSTHPLSFVPHAHAARPTPTYKVLSFRN